MVKIYQQPFAHAGTKQVIPDASDPQGFVSNADGFTTDYELPDTDPNYKPIERAEFNGLMNMVTESLGEIQQFGFTKWQPMTWPQGARVVEGGVVYRALVQTSQQPPHADWVPDIESALQPSITDSIKLNGTIDNSVILTNIVTKLGLEVGDVIRIDTGSYNKLHTVELEFIADNSTIIVNYEHAGNRGNGSLKLPDFTGQATVTRVAKWFNAPIGLGQEWQDSTGRRSANTVYTNTTGRSIDVNIFSGHGTNSMTTILIINGIIIYGFGDLGTSANSGYSWIVPPGATYQATASQGVLNIDQWTELR